MISSAGIPLSFLLMIMLSVLSSSSSYSWADDMVELEPEDNEELNNEFPGPLTFVYDFYAAIWSFYSSSSNYYLQSFVCGIILEYLTMKLIGKLTEGMVIEEKVKYFRHFDLEICSLGGISMVSRRIDAWNMKLNLRESLRKLRLLRNLLEKVEKKQSFVLKRRLELEKMKNYSDDHAIVKRDDDFPRPSGHHGINDDLVPPGTSSTHSTGDDANKSLLEVSSKINPDGIGDVDDDYSNIDVLKKIPQNVGDKIYVDENIMAVSSKINKNDDSPKTIPRISDIDQNSLSDDADAAYRTNDFDLIYNKNTMKISSKINPSVTDDVNDDTNVDVSKTIPKILDIDDPNSSSTNVDSNEGKMENFDPFSPSGTCDIPSNQGETQGSPNQLGGKIKLCSKDIAILEMIKRIPWNLNNQDILKEVDDILENAEITEDDEDQSF